LNHSKNKILFIKPPDRFLGNEFAYLQLGPHYLQSYLDELDIPSDILVLYERQEVRQQRENGDISDLLVDHLNMLFLGCEGHSFGKAFNLSLIGIMI